MSGWVVADASTFIATVLEESYTIQARALIASWTQQNMQVAAPTLFQYEVVAAMRKNVVRGIIAPEQGVSKRDILMAYPIQFLIHETLLKRGYELATEFNRPTAYDSQYLAVAEHLRAEFWTADERLYNVCSPKLSWVKWVRNFGAV